MIRSEGGRPFYSYVVTQSALVLIALAASFLATDLLAQNADIVVDRMWVSIALLLTAQLPVAALYARNETRELTSGQGWALAAVFIGVTLVFEACLLASVGQLTDMFNAAMIHVAHKGGGTFLSGAAPILIGVLLLGFVMKAVYQLGIWCELRAQNSEDDCGHVITTSPKIKLAKAPGHDLGDQYRRWLIGTNIAIFGLSLALFGQQFMHVLKLSVPMSIVFSVVLVANQLAGRATKKSLSKQCLHISIHLMPLTVTGLILLGLSALYADFVAMTGASVSPMAYGQYAATKLMALDGILINTAVFVGFLFALCLAANTLMLFVFAKLIKPLVQRRAHTQRPSARPVFEVPTGEIRELAQQTVQLTRAKELHQFLSSLKERTERPPAMA